MSTKFKPGDKVWVKGEIADSGRHVLNDSEFVVISGMTHNPYWVQVCHDRIRPRVKRKTLTSASDDVLLTGVRRILLTIAVCAGMQAAQSAGERLGRNRALCKVRDHLGDVSYVASRMVKEVVDALQWDVTEEVRNPVPPPVLEMDAVKRMVGALRRLDHDAYLSGYDSSLSLGDVLEVKV